MSHTVRSVSLALVSILTANGSATSQEPLLRTEQWARSAVPEPDLTGLEPVVARQLEEARRSVLALNEEGTASNAQRAEAWGDLGRLYHAYDLAEAAGACYRLAAELSPSDWRWPHALGHLLQGEGELDRAAQALTRALELHEGDLPALVYLGEIRLLQGRLDEAEARFSAALSLDADSAAAHAGLGQVGLSRRDYEAAVRHLEAALERAPEANRIHHPLGLAYRGLGRMEEARWHLTRAGPVGVRPADPWIEALADLERGERLFLLRGRLAYRAGRFQEAVEAFARAVEAHPTSVRARINLGTSLARAGRTDEAIRRFEEALDAEPDNATVLFNLGALLRSRGRAAEALPHLERLLVARPQDGEGRLELAHALRDLGWSEEALSHYRRAVELEPASEEARWGEAVALVEAGRHGLARDRLEEAHRLLPEEGRIAVGLVRLLAAAPRASLRDGTRALELAERIHAASPTPSHTALVALALGELGRCEDAATWQERALEAAQAAGNDALVSRLRPALGRYRDGPPCGAPLAANVADPSP